MRFILVRLHSALISSYEQKRKGGVLDCGGAEVLFERGYLLMAMSFATKNCRRLSEI
jgi:hypothetical protein